MALKSVVTAPFILIEDDCDKNTIPLLRELIRTEKEKLYLFAYEQPLSIWKTILSDHNCKIHYCNEVNPNKYTDYVSSKCTLLIDSVNQMHLSLGWNICINFIQTVFLNPNIRMITVLHKDCVRYNNIRLHLNHLASAIISYNFNDSTKISVRWKKSGKLFKSKESLIYDNGNLVMKSIKDEKQNASEEVETAINKIATFKISLEDNEKVERDKLELPYMTQIHSGQSKVYYEPDVVDDWDDEDPDDDLDI